MSTPPRRVERLLDERRSAPVGRGHVGHDGAPRRRRIDARGAASMRSRSRPQMATRTPSAARARAVASPRPLEAPATAAARCPFDPEVHDAGTLAVTGVATGAPRTRCRYDPAHGTSAADRRRRLRLPAARHRAGRVELGLRRRRRRPGGRHLVGPAPHPQHDRPLRHGGSTAPARRLVNTHHNGDHCWGNQLFAEAGTEIIGHRLCAEYFTRRPAPSCSWPCARPTTCPPPLDGFARSLRRLRLPRHRAHAADAR